MPLSSGRIGNFPSESDHIYYWNMNSEAALIYALVSRGNSKVLCEYMPHSGNFQQVALDVLKRLNLSKSVGQFGTANYNFYSYTKDSYVFLVMVGSEVTRS